MSAPEFVEIVDADWFAINPTVKTTVAAYIPGEFGPDVGEYLKDATHMVLVIRDTVRVLTRPGRFTVEDDE